MGVPGVTGEATSICGWGLSNEAFCYEPSEEGRWCATHDRRVTPETQCVGCGAIPLRECSAFVGAHRCGEFLCADCDHQPTGKHSPALSEVELATQDLESALETGLVTARSRGLCAVHDHNVRPLAEMLIQHLSTHVVMKVLSGLATPPK